jgi:hypothetical protein
MKKNKFSAGDTVTLEGKHAIVEAFYKKQIVVYLVDEQERYLVYPNKLLLCVDKWEEMVKSAEE